MLKVTFFVLLFSVCYCQLVNNVRLIGHIEYIVKVIQNVVLEVEDREWCNLKLPEIRTQVNETIFDDEYLGEVRYFNGFVKSIQRVDILQTSVQQVWSFNVTDGTGSVALRGHLRLSDLALGYDVEADINGEIHRYSAVFKHDLIAFAFDMIYNLHRDEFTVTVTVTPPIIPTSRNPVDFLPKDELSDVLGSMFQDSWTHEGIHAWGEEYFVPITLDVIPTVEFPRICYDCPVT